MVYVRLTQNSFYKHILEHCPSLLLGLSATDLAPDLPAEEPREKSSRTGI